MKTFGFICGLFICATIAFTQKKDYKEIIISEINKEESRDTLLIYGSDSIIWKGYNPHTKEGFKTAFYVEYLIDGKYGLSDGELQHCFYFTGRRKGEWIVFAQDVYVYYFTFKK